MIEWKKFHGPSAPDNVEGNEFLILVNGQIVQAIHDAANHNFYRVSMDCEIVYSYQHITHYAEINLPEAIVTNETA